MASNWVVEIVNPMASPWVVEVARGTTGSAARHRVFTARWGTILRHCQRRASREQHSNDREALQHSHRVLQMLTPLTRMSR